MEIDFRHHHHHQQQTKSHCQKCGRRNRKYQMKHYRQQRPFPVQCPSYSFLSSINANHSKNRSNEKNIIIDQLIEVKQLSASPNPSRNHPYYDDLIDRKHVQQMIYLRENINNSNYREIHFSSEYVILKRLEEKIHPLEQNRFRMDHYYRPLKLQYQTISTLIQNIPIMSFNYSKDNSSMPENRSVLTTDSFISITPYRKCNDQNYSTNTISSLIDINSFTFETAVTVDVRKCSSIITHDSSMKLNWNQIKSVSNASLFKENQSDLFSVSIHDQQINKTSWSYSKNSNYKTLQQELQVVNELSDYPPDVIRNDLIGDSSTNKDISSIISIININNFSIKYTKILQKFKQILNILQQHFLRKWLSFQCASDEIDRSITETMTSDSLMKTYSIVHRIRNQSENEVSRIEANSLNKNFYYSNQFKLRNPAKNINYNQQNSDDDDDETKHSSSSQSKRVRLTIYDHRPARSMSSSFMFILQTLLILCLINRILLYHIFDIVSTDSLISLADDDSQSTSSISFPFNKKIQEKSVIENKDKTDHFLLSLLNLI